MPHIHRENDQYDLCTCAFIVRTDTPEPTAMLHKHRTLGSWMQFGGHVELHENPWQALAHELREESGYSFDDLMLLQPPTQFAFSGSARSIAHPVPAAVISYRYGELDHLHTDLVYMFVADYAPRHAVNDSESSEFRCFTRKELAELPDTMIPKDIRSFSLFALDTVLQEWKQEPASNWSLDNPGK